MRNLVRKPLTWIVVAECVVVTVLLLVAWDLVAAAAGRHGQVAAPAVEALQSDAPPSLPALPASDPPVVRGPLPGLNVDSGFWRSRLGALNREQVIFEQLEWHVMRIAMDAAQHYVETVVLPSVTRAERARGDARLAEGG
jgi:hypothetical protein